MWYEPPAKDTDCEKESKTQSNSLVQVSTSTRMHVWCAPWPVDNGGPTLYHATKCMICDAPGIRVNRSGKAKKGRNVPQPWCPETCPGAPRNWESFKKQDLEQTDDITNEPAETAHTLLAFNSKRIP